MIKSKKIISSERALSILKKPITTEKSTNLQQFNQYTFMVSKDCNSYEIKQAIEQIFKVKVIKINTSILIDRTNTLQGKSFVISGVFKNHSRDELESLIDKNSGKNTSSISKKTSYLIAGENMGPSKREKAEKLGIPIISEDEFLSLLQ